MLAGEGINGRQIVGRTDSNGRDGLDGHCFPKEHGTPQSPSRVAFRWIKNSFHIADQATPLAAVLS